MGACWNTKCEYINRFGQCTLTAKFCPNYGRELETKFYELELGGQNNDKKFPQISGDTKASYLP